jgi:uncharacterized protein
VDASRIAAWLLSAAILASGIGYAGHRLGDALYAARAADRYLTVRGLAERIVPANVALWPIVFTVSGNDLAGIQSRLERDADRITTFLVEQGFDAADITLSAPRLTDRIAQGYDMDNRPLAERYTAEATVTLRTGDIAGVGRAIERSGELVRDGVTVVRSYEFSTQYLYTDLETIKPEMIAEATRDARRAAEQFAADSGSRVGAIRNAQQGFFSIDDRDAFSPEFKTVRVVTTVQYYVED